MRISLPLNDDYHRINVLNVLFYHNVLLNFFSPLGIFLRMTVLNMSARQTGPFLTYYPTQNSLDHTL